MKKLIIICFLSLLSSYAIADINDNIELESIGLYELARLVFTNLNRMDFTADNDFLNDKRQFTVILKNKSARQMKLEVIEVIENAGFFVNASKDTIKITKNDTAKPPLVEPHVYFPKHREITYLTDQLTSVFKKSNFTINRQIENQMPNANGATPMHTNVVEDSGTSAFSKISKQSDFMIFNGEKKDYDLFQKLVKQIDIPESQVEIKAYLYEVKNGKSDQSGFKLAASLLGGLIKASVGGSELSNSLSLSLGNIDAAISMLNSDDRFKLVSNPYIIAKNNQKAVFSVGSDVPVLGNITSGQNGQVFQSVEYKQSGVILDILPRIYDKSIELTIHHQISNFINTTTGVNNTPTLIKRELNTVIKSNHDDVLLLGGLNENTETSNRSGLPFLPDFLKSKSTLHNQSEIMLLLAIKKI